MRGRARAALIAVTLIWGSTFVVVHSSLDRVSPLVLLAVRFAIAALALALLRPGVLRAARAAFGPALWLSLSLLAGMALQTFGLQSTTPARSAFLTALSVLMVPAIVALQTRRLPGRRLLLGVGLATLGVYLLFRPIGLEWRRGDTLTVLSALAFAIYVVELARQARRHRPSTLVFVQCVAIALGAALASPLLEEPRFELGFSAVAAVVYLGLLATAVSWLLMTWGQARVEATEAGIIYALEPVFAAVFSTALGRDPVTLGLILGGGLVVAAMLIGEVEPSRKPAPPAGID